MIICTQQYSLEVNGSPYPPVTPEIFLGQPSLFGNPPGFIVPAGNYRVLYLRGAMRWTGAAGFSISPSNQTTNPDNPLGGPGGYYISFGPSYILFPNSTTEYPTQALCEMANHGLSVAFVHPGGLLSIANEDWDFGWANHVAGNPNPTFSLVPV